MTPRPGPRAGSWRDAAVVACFCASGATSLAEEVLWVRQLSLVFGSTTYAISTVVAVFMAGLALGAWWIGRRADAWPDPLRAYGRLELGIGGYALCVPLLFAALVPLYRLCWAGFGGGFAAMTVVRVLGSALVLLVPTTLMGATLPLLVRHFTHVRRAAGREAGRLYAYNTAGAVLGCIGGGLWLIPGVGETGTLLSAAGTDLAVGALVLGVLARGGAGAAVPPPVPEPAPEADPAAAAPAFPPPPWGDEVGDPPPGTVRTAFWAFGLAGAAGLILEVSWTRLLSLMLGTSVYSFTIILAIFLVAIAAGSALGTRWILPRVRNDLDGFANLQAYAGVTALLLAMVVYERLPLWFVHLAALHNLPSALGWAVVGCLPAAGVAALVLYTVPVPQRLRAWVPWAAAGVGAVTGLVLHAAFSAPVSAGDVGAAALRPTHATDLMAMVLLGAVVVIPPILLSAAGFPLLVRGVTPALERVGSRVGALYAANTVGAIAGSLVAGFALVPGLGIETTVLLGAGGMGVAAIVAGRPFAPGRTRAGINAAVAGLLVLILPHTPLRGRPWDPGLLSSGPYMYGRTDSWPTWAAFQAASGSASVGGRIRQVLFYDEGLTATVAVYQSSEGLSLRVNGKDDASSVGDMPTQTLVGHLPMLLAPSPRRVMVVGVGSGVTVDAVSRHAPERLAAVELEAAVIRGAGFFNPLTRDLTGRMARGEVECIADDARNYLLASPEQWDVIVSEPSNPFQAASAKVFTREFLEGARARLAPEGVFAQWLQVYLLDTTAVSSIVRTFRQVFPHVYIFSPLPAADLVLVGSRRALPIDFGRIAERMAVPAVRAHLERNDFREPGALLGYLVADPEGVERFLADHPSPVNTDDNAFIEYHAPRTLRMRGQGSGTHAALQQAGAGAAARVVAGQAAPGRLLEEAARSALARSEAPNRFEVARRNLLEYSAELAQQALAHGDRPGALELRGRSRYRLDPRTERAAYADWTRALKLDPNHLPARLRMAEYFYDLRFWEDSAEQARAALQAHPESAEAATALGRALARDGRSRAAVAVLAPVVAADPQGLNPTAWLFLGVAELALGDSAALTHLERYLQMRPNEPRARKDYVTALRRAGRLDDAARQEAWLQGRDDADRWADEARRSTEAATRCVVDGDEAGAGMRLNQAEARWRKAILAYPFEPEYHKRLFYLLRQRGRFDATAAALRAMLGRFRQSRWAATRLAFMLELQVRRGEAADPGAALAEAATALERVLPYSLYRFSRDDLAARAARLRHWTPRAGGR